VQEIRRRDFRTMFFRARSRSHFSTTLNTECGRFSPHESNPHAPKSSVDSLSTTHSYPHRNVDTLLIAPQLQSVASTMRPLWTGALTFGLVNIPVRLHSAVQAKERVSFRLLHKTDLSPIRYERVCQKEGDVVDWKEIVKGYEYTKGKFVVLSDDDFKAAAIESSKTIEIMDFVKSDEIDARYFETPYYVVPAKGGEKAYALLREAIKRTGMVGIGKITMRSNSLHLAGIKAVGEALILEIMRFEEELVDLSDMTLPSDENVRPQELQMAEQLVANLSQPFDPSKYTDDYRANLMKIIRAKMKGKKIEVPEPEERESTQVVDLMARLQESLEMGKKQKAPRAPRNAERTRGPRGSRSARRKTA
jgi:DNA end-binding protein Ku